MLQKNWQKEYLGDSVYAEFDGRGIIFSSRNTHYGKKIEKFPPVSQKLHALRFIPPIGTKMVFWRY